MPYKTKGKCVFKKDTGKKVGCTTGSLKKYLSALHANESVMTPCGCQQDVENFSDDVRNTTVGELLLQIKGNDDDLHRALVQWLREHYQEFNEEPLQGPPEMAPLDSGVVGDIMQNMKSGMGLGGGESITTRGPKIVSVRIHKESKKQKKGPDTNLMIEAFKDLKDNHLI